MGKGVIRFLSSKNPLSNFYESYFCMMDVVYPTVEHWFQSEKAENPIEKTQIIIAESPAEAKKLGRKCKMRSDWNEVKNRAMYTGLYEKFTQSAKLRAFLLGTGNKYLIEDNKRDSYWGIGKGDGQNIMGRLLMVLRWRLRKEDEGKVKPRI